MEPWSSVLPEVAVVADIGAGGGGDDNDAYAARSFSVLGDLLDLRGRQYRKKKRMPAMMTAASAPTTIPAIAPPERDELSFCV
jgi:hypothetical protein